MTSPKGSLIEDLKWMRIQNNNNMRFQKSLDTCGQDLSYKGVIS